MFTSVALRPTFA